MIGKTNAVGGGNEDKVGAVSVPSTIYIYGLTLTPIETATEYTRSVTTVSFTKFTNNYAGALQIYKTNKTDSTTAPRGKYYLQQADLDYDKVETAIRNGIKIFGKVSCNFSFGLIPQFASTNSTGALYYPSAEITITDGEISNIEFTKLTQNYHYFSSSSSSLTIYLINHTSSPGWEEPS